MGKSREEHEVEQRRGFEGREQLQPLMTDAKEWWELAPASGLQVAEEFATRHVLHDEKDAGGVLEPSQEPHREVISKLSEHFLLRLDMQHLLG